MTLIRNILEKAFTMGPVISLANPHMAKHDVIRKKGITKLTPSLVSISVAFKLIFILGDCFLQDNRHKITIKSLEIEIFCENFIIFAS